jgi:hypothetical protein
MNMFDGPIPGQSLTGSPKAYPWERPPEIVDPEEALVRYLTNLNGTEQIEGILDMLELEMDVKTLTEGLVRVGVAEGLHSIDVGLIISPVIHEFIVSVAEEAGIEYDEGLVDKKAQEEKKKVVTKAKKEQILQKLRKERQSGSNVSEVSGTDNLEMALSEAPIESQGMSEGVGMEEEIMPEQEAPRGLMARRG